MTRLGKRLLAEHPNPKNVRWILALHFSIVHEEPIQKISGGADVDGATADDDGMVIDGSMADDGGTASASTSLAKGFC